MLSNQPLCNDADQRFVGYRRGFLKLLASSLILPTGSLLAQNTVENRSIKFGLIADLHQDVIHDAQERLETFIQAGKDQTLDALIQLGDFATPIPKNRKIIETFNSAHAVPLHVIGNHDTDGGLKTSQVVDGWGMKNRYYSAEVRGIKLIVLDGNDRPKDHTSGYPAHVAEDQLEWFEGELTHQGPMIVLCHQPLAGPKSIDNAPAVQTLLAAARDRILVVINGHTHIDEFLEIEGIHYWHVNSAAYHWVGEQYKHLSYSPEIHSQFRDQSFTCPYRQALFSFLEVDLSSGQILITGRETSWVGSSPAELGKPNASGLESGKQIVPSIRSRNWNRA